MSSERTRAAEHLARAGVVLVANQPSIDLSLHAAVQAAGGVNVTPLLREWATKRDHVHTTWTELQQWMTAYNVHLKRVKQGTMYVWTNGLFNCAERLRIRLPYQAYVYDVLEHAPGIFEVVVAANKAENDFAQWYTDRLSYKDPATQRQDLVTVAQRPLVEDLGASSYILRFQCLDAALLARCGIHVNASLRARITRGVVLKDVLLEVVGVQANTSMVIHMIRMLDATVVTNDFVKDKKDAQDARNNIPER